MFLEYQKENTILHNLDIRTKGLGFIIIIMASFLFSNPLYNLVIFLICLILAYMVNLPLHKLTGIVKPLIPILVLIIVLASFSYKPEAFQNKFSKIVLFTVFSEYYITCTIGGLLFGISLSIRIFTMVIASTLFTYTTSIDHFLLILRKIRLSYKIAFILATGIRFIPTMEKKSHQIIDAQKTRGASFNTGGLLQKVRAYIPVMIPMIVESLRMSENLAMAMLNRGFGASKNWTVIEDLYPQKRDIFISVLLLFFGLLILYMKSFDMGSL